MVHSDRGSQYCSEQYQALLAKHDLACSMSAKGNCHDNACAESFFLTFKVELIHSESFANREAIRQAVFEYIEIDDNRTWGIAPTATSARWPPEPKWSLKQMSDVSGQDHWAAGYCVSTVGLDEATIRNYVRDQDKIQQNQMALELE